jgi:hypothetical protein
MDIWARIIDLPLGSINKIGGERAMGLIGEVKRMDVDKDVKTSGPYLRARVSIEVSKPVHRGVMLKAKEEAVLEWFDIQYEKIPYFCSSCGVMGHSHLECDKPLIRNNDGKLSYEVKQLRVQDPKRKKLQSFSEVAADTFGSAASSMSKQPSGSANLQETDRFEEHSRDPAREDDEEVPSPLKQAKAHDKGVVPPDGSGKTIVGELGKNLSPSNLRRFCNSREFGDIGGKELSSVFNSIIYEERSLRFRKL